MDELRYRKVSKQSPANVSNLCAALDISETDLEQALNLPENQRYTEVEIDKADGSLRKAFKPHYLIRRVQRRINNRIFSPQKKQQNIIAWPNYIFGSIPNQIIDEVEIERDYIACAKMHCKSKSILKIDIKNFFDNVHKDIVFSIFEDFLDFPKDVSLILTELCCYENRIPQGGLTSSYLASLALFDIEHKVVRRLNKKGLVYTRLVDDITVSSKVHNYDFSFARKIITDMLYSKDLPINEAKTKIERSASEPLTVHGLRVCFKEPRLPSDEAKRIRAAVKNVEIVAKERHYRTTHAYRKDYNRCLGRVNKLSRVGHSQHQKLVDRLKKIKPLPSKKDITRCTKLVERLEKDYALKGHHYWYWRRYNKAHERLNVLQRTFVHISDDLRSRLKTIKPGFEA
jgi:RNA-directed DNA polymerase